MSNPFEDIVDDVNNKMFNSDADFTGITSHSVDAVTPPGPGPWTITVADGIGGNTSPVTSSSIADGATPAYTITPLTGYSISNVLLDGSSVLSSGNYNSSTHVYTFSAVHANHTLSTVFSVIPPTYYTITVTPGSNGTITPSTSTTILAGTTPSYTITPNAGYEIANVLVDGSSVLSSGNYNPTTHVYTFPAVSANHTITSTYTAIIEDITSYRLPNMSTAMPTTSDYKAVNVPIGFNVSFSGTTFNSVTIDTNGFLAFIAGGSSHSYPLPNYAPQILGVETELFYPMIAGIWDDIDISGSNAGNIYYGQTTISGTAAFVVQYRDVGYHFKNYDKLNDFDIRIINNPGGYHFEIYVYRVQHTDTYYANGAVMGIQTLTDVLWQHPNSGVVGGLLDSNPNGAHNTSYGSALPGKYVFTS